MKRGSNSKEKTAVDGDSDATNKPSREESGYDVDDRRPDKHRRPAKEKEDEETDRLVREITPSMKEWKKVTGSKQKPSAKKSKQLATATE